FNNIDEKPFNDDRPVWTPAVRVPKADRAEAYNRELAHRSELQGKLNAMRLDADRLVAEWLGSRKNPAHPVSIRGLIVRLRLDEGGGEELKNSAPNANPGSFKTTTMKPEWGETTWLWPDFRMQSSTRVLLGQTADYEATHAFSAGGWFMFRSAPFHPGSFGTLLSKMESTQHNRGWDVPAEDTGFLSVALVNQSPKEGKAEKKEDKKDSGKKPPEAKEPFNYPSPQDLSKKDLAPNKPPEQLQAEKDDRKKDKAEAEAEAKKKKSNPAETPDEKLREVAIRV